MAPLSTEQLHRLKTEGGCPGLEEVVSGGLHDPSRWSVTDRQDFWDACLIAARQGYFAHQWSEITGAIEECLDAGWALPAELGGWMLIDGQASCLDRWRLAFPAQVPALYALANQTVKAKAGEQPVLHALVAATDGQVPQHEALLERVLAEGADAKARGENGAGALEHASSLRQVRALINAGLNPMEVRKGVSVLERVWRCEHQAAVPSWTMEWVELLQRHARPVDRVPLAFLMAKTGQRELLRAMIGRWGWSNATLHGLRWSDVVSGKTWAWGGWLAHLSMADGCFDVHDLLLDFLESATNEDRDSMDPWSRAWLAVWAFDIDANGARVITYSKKVIFSPTVSALAKHAPKWGADKATKEWALTPGAVDFHQVPSAFRHWLARVVVQTLEDPSTSEASVERAWKWVLRLLLEERDGQERMPGKVYASLRLAILQFPPHFKAHGWPVAVGWLAFLVSLRDGLAHTDWLGYPLPPDQLAYQMGQTQGLKDHWIVQAVPSEEVARWPAALRRALRTTLGQVEQALEGPQDEPHPFSRDSLKIVRKPAWLELWKHARCPIRAALLEGSWSEGNSLSDRVRL